MIDLEKIFSGQEAAKGLRDNFDVNILEMFIIRPLIEEARAGTVHAIDPLSLLYEILCEDKEQSISPQLVYEITDILFADSDEPFDVREMKRLMESPYGRWVSNHILFGFRDSISQGSPRFVYPAGAVMALKWKAAGMDVVDTALDSFLGGIEPVGKLLGLAAFGLVCRDHLCGGYLDGEGYLHMEEQMVDAFVKYLTEKDRCLYATIVTTVRDMVLMGRLDTRVLMNAALIQAAVETLEDPMLGAYAENLLSLMPLDRDIGMPALGERYTAVYEEAFNIGDPGKLLKLFRMGMLLNSWDAEKALAEYKKVMLQLGDDLDPQDRPLLALYRYTNCELMALFHSKWLTATPEAALRLLLAPLPEERKASLEALAEDPDPCHVIDDAKLAAEVINYCHNAVRRVEGYALQTAAALMNSTRLCCGADEGTAIAVRWFYLLCRLGDGAAGVEFYNSHRAILNRPALYDITFAGEERPGADMADFFRASSRLARGMKLAQMHGNVGILDAFRELAAQAEDQGLRQAMESIGSGKDTMAEPSLFLEILVELRSESMTKAPLFGFDFYYDDMTVALHSMGSNPRLCPEILGAGYGGVRAFVLDAVYDCGINIMRQLPYAPVRQDKDVLLEAMLAIGRELKDD